MADNSLIESVLSGVLTGGATAGTAVLGFFRDQKRRVKDLEARLSTLDAKIGSQDEKKGVVFALFVLQEAVEKIQEGLEKVELSARKTRGELEDWNEHPPEWAMSLRRRGASINLEHQEDFERGVNNRLRDLDMALQEFDTNNTKVTRKIVGLEEGLRASDEARARELAVLREQLASINGLLRGLQAMIDGGSHRGTSGPPRR